MTVCLSDGLPTLSGLGREKHALQGQGGGNMPCRVKEVETCPAGLGRAKHVLVW